MPWRLVLLQATAAAVLADPIMVGPVKEQGVTKLLLYVPGGKVPPEDYLPMIKAAQLRSSLRLSAAVVRCHLDLCDPVFEVGGLMEDAIARANKTGSLARSDIFVVGHSLGGVGARHFFDAAGDYAGLAQFGTQTNGDHEDFKGTLGYPEDLAAFPRPFLAVAGELDMVPISHTAELVRQSRAFGAEERLLKVPIVVAGMDHSQFCPPFEVKGDIKPEISNSNATGIAGDILAAWLDHVVLGPRAADAATLLQEWVAKTEPLVAPYLAAAAADAPWCAQAQRLLARAVAPEADISVSVEERFASSSLEHCHPNATLEGGRLAATVCTYIYRSYLNSTLPSFLPTYQGADDIGCKMVAEDKIAALLNLSAPNMSSPAVANRCASINQQALGRAKELVTESRPLAVKRFEAQGKRIAFQNDSQALIGPQWLLAGLSVTEGDGLIEVQAEALISPLSSWVYPGNHYCKLLSLSKAVEMVMTTALTQRYGSLGSSEILV